MAPNDLGRMGSLSSFKRPNFPVQKKAFTFPRPHRIGISASEHSRLHSRTSGKTGGGKGTRPTFSRFLQPSLSGTKEERLLETGHRSQSVQHLSTEANLQNGNTGLHPEFHQAHALGSISGPGRCLLPCPYPPQLQEVPALCFSRPGLPCPLVWL